MKKHELKDLIRDCIEEVKIKYSLDRDEKNLQEAYKITEKKFDIPIPTIEQRIKERKKLMEELERDPSYIKIKNENLMMENSNSKEYRIKKLQNFKKEQIKWDY